MKLVKGNTVKYYFEYYYNVPHTRIAPYLIGMLAGLIYYEDQADYDNVFTKFAKLLQNSSILRYIIYFVSAIVIICLIQSIYFFDKYPDETPYLIEKTYLVFAKSLFVLALLGIIFPAMLSKGRIQNTLLSSSIYIPLGRITYNDSDEL